MWSKGKTLLFRSGIFAALTSLVTTIIYFTPYPGQDVVSCERPCHELEMPMICRIKLVIEQYETLSGSCSSCPDYSPECFKKYCISGDGTKRSLLTANRQLPGPNIQVCENDILVVDVVNRVPGREVSLHWRGQRQRRSPFMDGVPMVTQCPVASATTFQYKFRVSNPGTHVWHAQTDQYSDGIVGGLIVRQMESRIEERDLYDIDDPHHTVIVNAWQDDVTQTGLTGSILINGRSQIKNLAGEFPASVFIVTPGKRHRFRLAHAGGRGSNCPITVSVDQHSLQVIALDGTLIIPQFADSISLVAGERADFVLLANQANASYAFRATTPPSCDVISRSGVAQIQYADAENAIDALEPTLSDVGARHVELATHSTCDNEDMICVTKIGAAREMPRELKTPQLDVKIFLGFGYKDVASADEDLGEVWNSNGKVPYMNNLTFVYPSSPLLSQGESVNPDQICNTNQIPVECKNSILCHCVHVVDIPLLSTVELVLVDEGGSGGAHVFHLHGYQPHVVGVAQLTRHVSATDARQLDETGRLLKRHLGNPVRKDTISVPERGVVALRLHADNPGYWLLDNDRSRGMNVVFRVGRSEDIPTKPLDFPQCGSWIGPEFFFI